MMTVHWLWLLGITLITIVNGWLLIARETATRATKSVLLNGVRDGTCVIDYRSDGTFFFLGTPADAAELFIQIRQLGPELPSAQK